MRTIDRINSLSHELNQLTVSLELARVGARPPVITALTGIRTSQAIEIYREVHGRVPKGRLHITVDWVFQSKKKTKVCTSMLQWYTVAIDAGNNHIQALLAAHESVCGEVSFNQAWQVVCEAMSGTIKLVRCNCCDAQYLLHWLDLQDDLNCPYCKGRSKAFCIPTPTENIHLPQIMLLSAEHAHIA